MILRLFIVLCLVGSTVITTNAPTAAQSQQTLRVWDWRSTEVPEAMRKIYAAFEREHNIKIALETFSWDELPQKILTACEAKRMPDVMEYWTGGLMPTLAESNCILSLDRFLAQIANIQSIKRVARLAWNGQYYSLPTLVWGHNFVYNTALLTEKYDPPRTWAELESTAKALTDKPKGIFGFAIPGNCDETLLAFENFIAQGGGRIGLPDNFPSVPQRVTVADIGINKPKAVQAIQFGLNLAQKYGPPFVSSSCKDVRDLFVAGKIAMYFDGANVITFLGKEQHPNFRIGTTRMPIGPVGRPSAVTAEGDGGISLTPSCQSKMEACLKFARFYMSPAIQRELSVTVGMVSATSGTDESLLLAKPRMWPATEVYGASPSRWYVLSSVAHKPPQGTKAAEIFKVEIQKAALGQRTVQQAMDAVAAQWVQLWTEWRTKYGASK